MSTSFIARGNSVKKLNTIQSQSLADNVFQAEKHFNVLSHRGNSMRLDSFAEW